ncbi:MAG: hypothetical protein MUC85_01765 [Anaerolineales bacterium]|nr:hypothetical protein [Anaerolineales bacterium]
MEDDFYFLEFLILSVGFCQIHKIFGKPAGEAVAEEAAYLIVKQIGMNNPGNKGSKNPHSQDYNIGNEVKCQERRHGCFT